MPYNFKGVHYDLRPYLDEFGWVVINRGPYVCGFKFHNKIKNKLLVDVRGHQVVDMYDMSVMKKQARKLIKIFQDKGKL